MRRGDSPGRKRREDTLGEGLSAPRRQCSALWRFLAATVPCAPCEIRDKGPRVLEPCAIPGNALVGPANVAGPSAAAGAGERGFATVHFRLGDVDVVESNGGQPVPTGQINETPIQTPTGWAGAEWISAYAGPRPTDPVWTVEVTVDGIQVRLSSGAYSPTDLVAIASTLHAVPAR